MPAGIDNVRVEAGEKRIRGYVGGDLVFDTTQPLLVWEIAYFPTYYVREADVQGGLIATGETKRSRLGAAEVLDLHLSDARIAGAALRYYDSPIERLQGVIRFRWDALDEWLEEDEPIYTHPRDPYTRVDILNSSRRVGVVIDGVTVAESAKPTILFETRLPARYYLPLTDVRPELVRPASKETHCPYKGKANYFSIEVNGKLHEDIMWIYRAPLPESQKIAGLVAFLNERVDLYVDGNLQERPKTKFS